MQSIPKPLAALVFILFWGIGIALWSCAHLLPTYEGVGYMIDIGIVFASIGFAAPFLASMNGLKAAAILGVIACAVFALGLVDVTVVVFMMRILVPLLALLTPLNKLLGFRVFA